MVDENLAARHGATIDTEGDRNTTQDDNIYIMGLNARGLIDGFYSHPRMQTFFSSIKQSLIKGSQIRTWMTNQSLE